jgi:exodeoxyribonuclease VII small subunit
MSTPQDSPVARFEEDLSQLERIVEQLERGELSLERSLDLFEQGMRLYRQCRLALETAEQRVNRILAEDEVSAPSGPREEGARRIPRPGREREAPPAAEPGVDDDLPF